MPKLTQQAWIKFYPADWEADAQLMSCSLAAQGLWLRMIRVMVEAEGDYYGWFVGRDGSPIDLAAFARRVGERLAVVRKLMLALSEAHVYSADEHGRIYSRRLVRERAKSLAGKEYIAQRFSGLPYKVPYKVPFDDFDSPPSSPPSRGLTEKTIGTRAGVPDPRELQSPRLRSDSAKKNATLDPPQGPWPSDADGLRALAARFVAAYANTADPVKIERQIAPYALFLAGCRERGAAPIDAWNAAKKTREITGRPLFGASIKAAWPFVRARKNGGKNAAKRYLDRHVPDDERDQLRDEHPAEKDAK